MITDTVAGQYGFNHNIYLSAFGPEFDRPTLMFPTIIRGNIIAEDSSNTQGRPNVAGLNDLWIRNPSPHTVADPTIGQPTSYSYEVYLEAAGNPSQNYEQGPASGGSSPSSGLDSYQYTLGTGIGIDHVLLANTLWNKRRQRNLD